MIKPISKPHFSVGLVFLFCILNFLGNAQVVTFMDTTFRQALTANPLIDLNDDGLIQVSEANAFNGSIDVNSLSISDLTGIEAFTSMTSLDCNNNLLTTINLVPCVALQALDCHDNNLSSLNLLSNSNLNDLDCGGNALISLDLSGNPNLSILYCYGNQLTSLDLSGNLALNWLFAGNNQLTSINISSNSNLSHIDCSLNNLNTISLGNKPNLTQFNCSNNNLSTLSLANCPQLSIFSCSVNNLSTLSFSPCPLLTQFNVSQNQLTELNCFGLDLLTTVNCFNNQITELNLFGNPVLTHVNCSNNDLVSLNVQNDNNQNLTTFDCTGNPLLTCIAVDNPLFMNNNWSAGKDAGASFSVCCSSGDVLFADPNLLTAILTLYPTIDADISGTISCSEASSYNGPIIVNGLGITSMVGISAFTSITQLECNNNLLTGLNVSNNTALNSLECGGNSLSTLDVSNNTALISLLCFGNSLSNLDLSSNSALTFLYCNQNSLSTLDVSNNSALAELYCQNNSLSTLDVSNNALLTYLYCNQNFLSTLDVSNNSLLFELICKSNSLTSLNLQNGNNINLNGLDATDNPSLTCIQVDNATYMNNNWSGGKDATAAFSLDCTPYLTAQNGDWNTASTWVCNCIPPNGSVIVIDHNVDVTTTVAEISSSLTINSGAQLKMWNTAQLPIGNFVNNGTVEFDPAAEASIKMYLTSFINNGNIHVRTASNAGFREFLGEFNTLGPNPVFTNSVTGLINIHSGIFEPAIDGITFNNEGSIINDGAFTIGTWGGDGTYNHGNSAGYSGNGGFYAGGWSGPGGLGSFTFNIPSSNPLWVKNLIFSALKYYLSENITILNGGSFECGTGFEGFGFQAGSATINYEPNSTLKYHLASDEKRDRGIEWDESNGLGQPDNIEFFGNPSTFNLGAVSTGNPITLNGNLNINDGVRLLLDSVGFRRTAPLIINTDLNIQDNGSRLINSGSPGATIQVGGNIFCDNNGNIFTNDNSIDLIGGNQSIQLDNPSTQIDILKINGSGTKTLASNLNIDQSLTFQSGILDLFGHQLNLSTSASIVNENNDNRIEDGNPGGYISISGTFGNTITSADNGNIGLEISAASPIGAATLKRYQQNASGVGASNSVNRIYEITTGSTLDASVSLTFLDNELNGNTANSNMSIFSSDNFGSNYTSRASTNNYPSLPSPYTSSSTSNFVFPANTSYFTLASACLVTFQDSAFRNAVTINPLIDLNDDGLIQCSEASAFTGTIDVNSLSITDLTGIEAFTSLSQLYVHNNLLTTIDISANTLLTHFNCNDNLLTSLDVSSNPFLYEFRCSRNDILSIDVSNHPDLFLFACGGNQLTTIDVSTNTNLEGFFCNDNLLTSLNVSSNPLVQFWCYGNQLTTLDVSNNPNLATLQCSDNLLTSLNLSANLALFELGCSNNPIVNLDLSANSALTTIECFNMSALTGLNIQNGNNSNLITFNATSNPALSCIQVDDVSYMNTNWSLAKDATTNYSTDCSCIVNIPDANFLAALVADVAINTNGDAFIQCSEASAFAGAMDVNGLGIADLTGIEAFANITSLSCMNNLLTSLNVSSNLALTILEFGNNAISSVDLSNNTQLVTLSFPGAQLSSIDLSNQPNLSLLDCASNQLNSLDVSNNPLLSIVFCEMNQLTVLDFSGLNSLSNLRCFGNNLTSLNIQNGNNSNLTYFDALNNPSLSCIQVDNVAFMNTNWSSSKDATANYSTDCSCLVNIPDANFKAALVADLSINTNGDAFIQCSEASAFAGALDVSNLSISDLTGIEAFTSLNGLNCNLNNLTTLDVSANTALIGLECSDNQITTLDLSTNLALLSLTCNGNPITSLDVSGHTLLENIYSSSCQLNSINLAGCTALNAIICDNNDLTSLDLSSNTALTYLDCNTNQLTALNLSANVNLTQLICWTNQLTNLDVSNNVLLNKIDCSQNQLSSIDVSNNPLLSEFFFQNNLVSTIDLSSNALITRVDCQNNLLSSLDLSTNSNLVDLACNLNQLSNLNIQNGNNTNLFGFNATNNPALSCIQVDDVSYMNTNWSSAKDATANYSTDCSCIVNIPDANFLAALVADVAINTNGDAFIQCSEASAFAGAMDVNGEGITDLTGIEAFANITSLSCMNNLLTSLNVSSNLALTILEFGNNAISSVDLSNNTQLVTLSFPGAQLSSIDLSNQPNLSLLDCASNQLNSLDVSNNPLLSIVFCEMNQLTVLDFSGLNSLSNLRCFGNNLTSLNIQNGNNSNLTYFDALNNPSLTCIQVDDVAFMNTNWSSSKDATANYSTDCSCIVNIPDANFKAALVANLSINSNANLEIECFEASAFSGSIDVSGQGIIDLTGIEAFTSINALNCQFNSIVSMDISNNTLITDLNCYSNSLTSLNVSSNTNLTIIQCYDNPITSLNLATNTALVYLQCNNNLLTSLDVSSNTALTTLNCINNLLTSLNIQNGNNSNLIAFNANNNPALSCIQVDDVSYMNTNWNAGKDPGATFNTDCNCTINIPDANFKAVLLADVLINTNSDGEIQCYEATSFTGAVNAGSASISDLTGIEAFPNITSLECSFNSLTSLDVSNNPNLTYLGCNNNLLPSIDLSANTALTFLRCSNNSFPSIDLSQNTSLGTLICDWTPISTLTVPASVTFVQCGFNSSLTSIDVSACSGLTHLDVYGNQIGSLDLTGNPLLTYLYCSFNGVLSSINVSNCPLLNYLGCWNNSISSIDLSNNPLLAQFIAYNNNLNSLNLTGNTSLTEIDCSFNQLTTLNIQNGNNSNLTSFGATNNPALSCIQVDNVGFMDANWSAAKDAGAYYSTNCSTGIVSVQDGDWNTTTTWNCNCIPPSLADVTIDHAVTVSSNVANTTGQLTINAGKSLTIIGAFTLPVGNLLNNGTISLQTGDAILELWGTANINNGTIATTALNATQNIDGTNLPLNSSFTNSASGFINNDGQIFFEAPGFTFINDGNLSGVGRFVVANEGTNATFNNNGIINHTGEINLGGYITPGGTFTIGGSSNITTNYLTLGAATYTLNNQIDVISGQVLVQSKIGFNAGTGGFNYATNTDLIYNLNGVQNKSKEWDELSGLGQPYNVTVGASTVLNMGFVSTNTPINVINDLNVSNNGVLWMDSLGFVRTAPLIVGHNLNMFGADSKILLSTAGNLEITGNMTVGATSTLLTNNAIVKLRGLNQNISIQNPATKIDKLEIIGGGVKTLQSEINIDKELIFTSGNIDLNGNEIELESSALIVGENNDNRCLSLGAGGKVYLNGSFGNTITNANAGNLGLNLTAATIIGNATVIRHHKNVNGIGAGNSVERIFELQAATTPDATVGIEYFDGELNGNPTNNAMKVYLSDNETSGFFENNTNNSYPGAPAANFSETQASTIFPANTTFITAARGALQADFSSAITTVCEGTQVDFTDLSTGVTGSTTYLWNFGDGNTSNVQGDVSHTYLTPGLFTVSLTLTDGATDTKTITDYITIKAIPPAPVLNITDNCGSSELIASNFTGTLIWSDAGSGNPRTVVGGSYSVTQDQAGCISASSNTVTSNPLTVPAAPVLSIIDNCGSSDVTAAGVVGTLIWSDAGSGNPRTIVGGTLTATQDLGGCISVVSNSVTSNPLSFPTTSVITGITTPNCNGTFIGYSVTLTAGSSYAWTVPAGANIIGGATGPDNNAIIVDFASSNGNVSVIETNASGCVGTQQDLAITLQGCALAANFTADVTTVCEGATVTFTDLSTGTTGSTTYAWDFGLGANPPTATGPGPHFVVYSTAGAANVSLTVTEGASNNLTQNNYITINTPVAPTITISSDNPSPCPGVNFNLTANVTNGGTGYTVFWYRDGSGIGSGNTINTTVVNASETYQAEFQTSDFCVSPQIEFSNTFSAAPQGLAANPGINTSGSACPGSPIQFSESYFIVFGPVTPTSFEWKVNGVVQGTTTSPFITSSLNDGDLVEGTMFYDDGCGIVNFGLGSINASIFPGITDLTINATDENCGSADGVIDITGVVGGVGPYDYQINGGGFSTTTLYSGLTAGSYTIEVKDINGCTYSEIVTINSISPPAPILTIIDNCGSSEVTASGFTGTLIWSDAGSGNPRTIVSGSLTVTQDVSGCISASSNSVTANPLVVPAAPLLSIVDNCGSSEVTAAGVVGTLIWSDAGSGNPRTIVGGTLTATQDLGGCISLVSNSVTSVPLIIPVTSVVSGNATPNCSETGVAYSVILTAGSSYAWSVPAGANITSGATGPDNNAITVDFGTTNGNVSVTETNASGCVGTAQNFAISLQGCALAANFTADVTNICEGATVTFTDLSTGTTGGTTYAWDFGAGASPATAVGAGPHAVVYSTAGTANVSLTITDGASNNLTQNNYITINTQPAAPVLSIVDNCGSSEVTAAGVVGTLIWSDAGSGNPRTIVSGTLSATQDLAGCVSAVSNSVTANPLAVPAAVVLSIVDNCGSSEVTAAGVVGTLIWSDAGSGNPRTIVGGTLTATQDLGGCISAVSNSVTSNPLSVPAAPVLSIVDNCGSSEVTAAGVVGTLIWSDAGSGNPRTIVGGTLTATQDLGGCISVVSNSVTSVPLVIPVTSVVSGNATPNCSETGVAYSVILTAGSSYAWSVPAGTNITSGATGPDNNAITVDFGTTNGNVSVTETNASGCVGTAQNFAISLQGCALAANFTADVTTVCEGATVIFTDLSTGTTGGTTYAWDFGAGASPATAVGAGPHAVVYSTAGTASVSLTVTDGASNNLTQNNYITINANPAAPVLTVVDNCGSSEVTAAGVVGTLIWSDAGSGNPRTIVGGTLTATQDLGGCISAVSNSVTSNPLSIPAAPVLSIVDNCGSSEVTAAGVVGTLIWSDAGSGNPRTIIGGTLTATQDLGGCISAVSNSVTSNPLSVPAAPVLSIVDNCGSSEVTAAGVVGTLVWSDAGSGNPRTIIGGTLTATQDLGGCISAVSNSVTSNPLSVPAAPVLSIVDNCGSSEVTAAGVVGTLIWSDAGSGNPRTIVGGTLTATQDLGGCISVVSNSVTSVPLVIPVTSVVSGNATPNCSETGVAYSVILTAGSSYAWSVPAGANITSGATGPDNNAITVDFGTTNGNVSVTETNASGCVGTAQNFAISLQGCALAANFTADVTTVCEGATVTFTDLSTGTTGGTTYAWDFGAGASPATAVGAGPHAVIYSTAGTASVSLTVTDGASDNLTQNNYITINTTPVAPVLTIVDNCGSSDVTAAGVVGTLIWSDAGSGNPRTIIGGTLTATQDLGGCISAVSNSVTSNPLTVPAAPVLSIVDNCGSSDVTAAGVVGTLIWSDAGSGNPRTIIGGTLTATQDLGGCLSVVSNSVTSNPLPIPATSLISGNQTPNCSEAGVGYSVVFTAGSNFAWTVPGGANITSGAVGPDNNAITIDFGNTNGDVSVIETNAAGCAGTQQNLTITLQGCALVANFTSDITTVCENGTVTFSDLSTGTSGSTTYFWDFGGGATPATATGAGPHAVVYSTAGQANVSLTITEGASDVLTQNNYITINPTPAAPVLSVVDNCGSSEVTAAGIVGTLIWSDAGSGNPRTIIGGTLTATQDLLGCVSLVSNVATSNPLPVPTTSLVTGNSGPNCNATGEGYSVTLTAGSNYAWTVPAGANITSGVTGPDNNAITVDFSNIDGNVSVIETNASGCIGTQQDLAVALVGCNLQANFSADQDTICDGATVTFTDLTTGAVGTPTYSWDFGAGANPPTATGAGPHTVVYSGAGQSTVVLTVNDVITSVQTLTNYITVNPLPAVANIGSDSSQCGGSITLNANISGPGINYLWSNGATAQSNNINTSGSYSVQLTDSNGCTSVSNTVNINIFTIPATPNITPNGSTTFCLGDSVELVADPSASYLWSTGATSQSIYALGAGPYDVTITDVNGCTATSAQQNLTLNFLPGIPALGPDVTQCGGTVTLDAVINGPGITYLWSNGGTAQTNVVSVAGNYYVELTNNCGTVVSDSVQININPFPAPAVITANGSTIFCPGGSVVLSSSYPTGNNWNTGSTNNSITVTTPGTYNLTYIDAFGCSAPSNTISVSYATANIPVAFNAFSTLVTDSNLTAVFNNLTPNISQYDFVWYFGDGTLLPSNAASVTHSYAYNGIYSVSLVAYDQLNCIDTLTQFNYLTANYNGGSGCSHTANILPSGNISACAGSTIPLNVSTNAGAGVTFQWNRNGVIIGGATQPNYFVSQNGNYTVTVFDSTGCPITSSSVQVNFNQSAGSPPVITASGTLGLCGVGSSTLTASGGFSSYLWSTGQTGPSIVVTQGGTYTVTGQSSTCDVISAPFLISGSNAPVPSICMITVDPVINKNVLVWEKPVSNNIVNFIIMREDTANAGVYYQIGVTAYTDSSKYIDMTSYANLTAYRYKMAVEDSCGGITIASNFHRSMHLDVQQGNSILHRQLTWNEYQNQPQLFDYHLIYRETTPNNFALLDSVPSFQTWYYDQSLTQLSDTSKKYLIAYRLDSGCDVTRAARRRCNSNSAGNERIVFGGVGLKDYSIVRFDYDIVPNPNNGLFTLRFTGTPDEHLTVKAIDLLGNELFNVPLQNVKNNPIDMRGVAPGVYYIQVGNQGKRIIIK